MKLSTGYYLRNENNVPLVTIMLVVNDEGNIARGMSICSMNDNPNKREGCKYATEHAIDALNSKSDIEFQLSPCVMVVLDSVNAPDNFNIYEHKGWFLPELSDFEIDLVNKAIDKVKKFDIEFNQL